MTGGYHEPHDQLSDEARDVHRAMATLIEELEAVDWYHQRIQVASDVSLRAMFVHHRDEELEHAAMAIEWLRRVIPALDQQLREHLFKSGPIVDPAHHG